MDIPPYLAQEVRNGKVVLFLGAGASMGATSAAEVKSPPTGIALAGLLSKRFLGGEASDKALATVADYCIATTDLLTVQEYIGQIFRPFEPAPFHSAIADFRWAALVTTNYDQIIEKAYTRNAKRLQTLVPVLRTRDRIDYELRDINKIAFLKLHGCISKIDDISLPLILTVDQYNAYKAERTKLFSRFEELAGEYTVVFVGYRVDDPNIREILQILATPSLSRPTHYLISPNPSELDQRVWRAKRIEPLAGTLEQFLAVLDTKIPKALRGLQLSKNDHPISAKFTSHATLSENARGFLENEVFYVHSGMTADAADAKAFYRGASYGWSAHLAGLDSKRNITDSILAEVVLKDDSDRPRLVDAYVLKGYAGSGKTVIFKRLAIETGVTFEKPVLYFRNDSRINPDAIAEIASFLGERLYLFIDGPARRTNELENALKTLRLKQVPVTVLFAERTGEWNVECQVLDAAIDDAYEVRALSGQEVEAILKKLATAGALGVLAHKDHQEQLAAFNEYANRQLLVALYEITSGKPFEEIIFDEYRQISSDSARRIYLCVCALNRLGVPVRAGLVHRVTGISLTDFKREFFKPLESIVLTEEYVPAADLAYRARHPTIAQIVFQKALPDQIERFNLYMELLAAIDIGYGPDRSAYRELVRARNLMDLFSDPLLVEKIFDAGFEAGGNDGYLYQQCAIFEMKRPGGKLNKAQQLLSTAKELLPKDRSITHSFSELEMARANVANTEIERRIFTEQAKIYAQRLTGLSASSGHGYSTLAKIELSKLKFILSKDSSSDNDLLEAARAVQQPLQDGLQQFRNDPHLLQIEADFFLALQDKGRAEVALRKANAANGANIFVALSLARLLESQSDPEAAREILKAALTVHASDKRLNSAMARLLQDNFTEEMLGAETYWRRSFTSGDTNFTSQFWYARALYINGKIDDAYNVFKILKTARVARAVKLEIAGWLKKGEVISSFEGVVAAREESNAWLSPFGTSKWIYLSRTEVPEEIWEGLRVGDATTFAIGFNYMGPAASISILKK